MEQGPTTAIPTRKLLTESNSCEFSPSFDYFHSQFNIFLTASFFELTANSAVCRRQSVNKGSKGLPLLSPPQTCLKKATAVSFPLILRFLMFSHHSLFQSNCTILDAACLPSVNYVNKSLLMPSHVNKLSGEGHDGEFPSHFYFHQHHSKLFLTASIFN